MFMVYASKTTTHDTADWESESMPVLAMLALWWALTARMFHTEEHGGRDGTRTRGLLRDRQAF
jgi:hypothetical protein